MANLRKSPWSLDRVKKRRKRKEKKRGAHCSPSAFVVGIASEVEGGTKTS